jgi:hypothetical protein
MQKPTEELHLVAARNVGLCVQQKKADQNQAEESTKEQNPLEEDNDAVNGGDVSLWTCFT